MMACPPLQFPNPISKCARNGLHPLRSKVGAFAFASHFTLVLLVSSQCEPFSSFAGLVIIDAAALHPQQAVEPARPLRLMLARAVGRAWLQVGVWLRSWTEAWLLMAMEGRLMHAYVRHAFGRNEATFRLHRVRRCNDDVTHGRCSHTDEQTAR